MNNSDVQFEKFGKAKEMQKNSQLKKCQTKWDQNDYQNIKVSKRQLCDIWLSIFTFFRDVQRPTRLFFKQKFMKPQPTLPEKLIR